MAPSATLIDVSSITFTLPSTRGGNTPARRTHDAALSIVARPDGSVISVFDNVAGVKWLPAVMHTAYRYGMLDAQQQAAWLKMLRQPLACVITDPLVKTTYDNLVTQQVCVRYIGEPETPLFRKDKTTDLMGDSARSVSLLMYRRHSSVAPFVLEQGRVNEIKGFIIRH